MNYTIRQNATFSILHAEHPLHPGDRFIEIRQWQTPDCNTIELIVEYGRLDESYELRTKCQVMPFYLTVSDILSQLDL